VSKRSNKTELDEVTAAIIALELDPVAPAPELRAKLMERITPKPAFQPAVSIRSDEGEWNASGMPGISVKRLYDDPATKLSTVLLRLQPGAKYPPHKHLDAEQCLVVEGDVRLADSVYHAGDFIVAVAGSQHPTITTVSGATMLLIVGHNEFVSA
jgi:anti-sigma factor ChrR (cupin superfamily)